MAQGLNPLQLTDISEYELYEIFDRMPIESLLQLHGTNQYLRQAVTNYERIKINARQVYRFTTFNLYFDLIPIGRYLRSFGYLITNVFYRHDEKFDQPDDDRLFGEFRHLLTTFCVNVRTLALRLVDMRFTRCAQLHPQIINIIEQMPELFAIGINAVFEEPIYDFWNQLLNRLTILQRRITVVVFSGAFMPEYRNFLENFKSSQDRVKIVELDNTQNMEKFMIQINKTLDDE